MSDVPRKCDFCDHGNVDYSKHTENTIYCEFWMKNYPRSYCCRFWKSDIPQLLEELQSELSDRFD